MSAQTLTWKKWVRWGLIAVLAVDALLAFYVWRNRTTSAQGIDLEALRVQHGMWKAEVDRAKRIQEQLPEVQSQCNRFFAEKLRSASGGYSTMVEDLGDTAKKAGLTLSSVNYQGRRVEGRGVFEVRVSATLEGEYASLVRFINGLERSPNFYLVDSIQLAPTSTGGIKLSLELKTYFRS